MKYCEPCYIRWGRKVEVSPRFAKVKMCESCATLNNRKPKPKPKEVKPYRKYLPRKLSKAEFEVLNLRLQGFNKKMIGAILDKPYTTIQNTCRRICDKMGCDTMVAAVILGVERGIIHKDKNEQLGLFENVKS